MKRLEQRTIQIAELTYIQVGDYFIPNLAIDSEAAESPYDHCGSPIGNSTGMSCEGSSLITKSGQTACRALMKALRHGWIDSIYS